MCSSSTGDGRTRWKPEAKIVAEPKEVDASKGFGENIGSVVIRRYSLDNEFFISDEFAYVVVLDADVFYPRMPNMVFSQNSCSVVVTVDSRRGGMVGT
jgi:hypothetical protein